MELPGKDLENRKLPLISLSFSSQHSNRYSFPTAVPWKAAVCASASACTQLVGARVDRRDPVLHVLRIYALTADCCCPSQGFEQGGGQPLLLLSLSQAPPTSAGANSRGCKRPTTSLPFIFPFFPFASQTLKIRTFFKLPVWGKLGSDHTCLRNVSEKI